ncbi:hypothetical protein CFD26_103917 [Aspergillus turcosus]|uniref:FAD-binding domain-containing protein n=1 Tax=Aspergillus turcosus TaxID=1245748 RepID=A0A3R7F4Y5_9EURO|nr:hypothetical protein CFD26_103917 [Aspergillus turcosus]
MVSEEAHLRIIIAGAGLGGLAAAVSCALSGHTVEVIEQTKELVEVGAGLQITPNASRLFKYWQLPNSVWQAAAEPTALTVHRYTGQILANEPSFHKNIRAKYDAPFIDLHRVDLQQALYARAKELGVTFHLNERVDSIDFDTTTVRTLAGNEYTGDLIIAADGLWSRCRECFLGKKDAPLPTGDLAYRIVLTADQISDPELRAWVENPECHFWIGPGAHAVAYSLRNGRMFNIVLLVPDNLPPGVSRQSGSVEEMRKLFEGWDPVLNRFLSYVDSVDKWKLMHHAEMESWVNDKSNLVFLGDACHPMLPYLAQGANSSLEDGAVLGRLLSHMKTKSHLPQILRLYESLRKSRGEAIVKETFKQRHDFHMPNGEEQEKRDEVFLSQLGKEIKGAFPSRCLGKQRGPFRPIALRQEYITDSKTTLVLSPQGDAHSVTAYKVKDQDGRTIFTASGWKYNNGSCREFRDASGLPLFELHRKISLKSAWYITLPGSISLRNAAAAETKSAADKELTLIVERHGRVLQSFDVIDGDRKVAEVCESIRHDDKLALKGHRPALDVIMTPGVDMSLVAVIAVIASDSGYGSESS